jgi:hypothetical protein
MLTYFSLSFILFKLALCDSDTGNIHAGMEKSKCSERGAVGCLFNIDTKLGLSLSGENIDRVYSITG